MRREGGYIYRLYNKSVYKSFIVRERAGERERNSAVPCVLNIDKYMISDIGLDSE